MLYQVFCLARPMASGELGSLIQSIGRVVYSTGGVVCDVKSYGRQFLAYKCKGVHGKYDQVRPLSDPAEFGTWGAPVEARRARQTFHGRRSAVARVPACAAAAARVISATAAKAKSLSPSTAPTIQYSHHPKPP